MARTPKDINWNIVKRQIEAGMTAKEIALEHDIHLNTFYPRFKKEFGVNFCDYCDDSYSCGNGNLKFAQYMRALKGSDKMLVHLGEFRLGQVRKKDIEDEVSKQVAPIKEWLQHHLERNPVKE
jgi:hypothetical protein